MSGADTRSLFSGCPRGCLLPDTVPPSQHCARMPVLGTQSPQRSDVAQPLPLRAAPRLQHCNSGFPPGRRVAMETAVRPAGPQQAASGRSGARTSFHWVGAQPRAGVLGSFTLKAAKFQSSVEGGAGKKMKSVTARDARCCMHLLSVGRGPSHSFPSGSTSPVGVCQICS